MKKALICIMLIAILSIAVLTSCNIDNKEFLVDIDYDLGEGEDNALYEATTLYDGAIKWLNEEYKYANRVKALQGAEDCPSEITNIITSQEDFGKAFDEFPVEINFDEQMLVLYFFASNNIFQSAGKRLRFYQLNNVTAEGGKIAFEIDVVKTELLIPNEHYLDATIPTHLCLAFLMPKMDIEEVEYNFGYKKYYITWQGELKSNSKLYQGDSDWLRQEYSEDINSALISSDILAVAIQEHEQFVTAFGKFFNSFDIEEEMLVLCFFTQDSADKNTYDYLLSSVEYEYGYLDISIDKIARQNQSGDSTGDIGFLAIRLPRLPVFNLEVKLN